MYDVIVIGAGPGGMTAAVYASRAGLKTAMIEKGAPGGQMVNTHLIENYPGYESIGGPELATNMFNHSQKCGAEYVYGDVVSVKDCKKHKEVICADGTVHKGKVVIIASGNVPRSTEVQGEDKFSGRGVSWCAICDGNFYKDKDVVVIGGGNSAFEESLYLANICNKVTIIHRRDTFRAEQVTIDKVKSTKNIEIITNALLQSFEGDNHLEGVTYKEKESGNVKTVKCEGSFVYIGLIPMTEFVKDLNITTDSGYIKVDKDMQTTIKGIYAIGDVVDKELRQIVNACGEGAVAAQHSIKYIESL